MDECAAPLKVQLTVPSQAGELPQVHLIEGVRAVCILENEHGDVALVSMGCYGHKLELIHRGLLKMLLEGG